MKIMIALLISGLLTVTTVYGTGEILDLSEMTPWLQKPNQARSDWGAALFDQINKEKALPEVIDSTEHGVKLGHRSTNCQCGWANRGAARIVGGKVHAPYEYPFIAGVAKPETPNRPFCGSVIISPWHIITAAHCTHDKGLLVVTLAEYDRSGFFRSPQYIEVRKIFQHPLYEPTTVKHDISLLFLSKAITYTHAIGPACIPKLPLDLVHQHVRIIGWGAMKFNEPMTKVPQKVDVRVIDMQTCYYAWNRLVIPFPATQICTHSEGKTACQGDSGGPVVWLDPETNRYTVVGLVSFGPQCLDHIPSVQTSVIYYLPWINSIIDATVPNQMLCTKI